MNYAVLLQFQICHNLRAFSLPLTWSRSILHSPSLPLKHVSGSVWQRDTQSPRSDLYLISFSHCTGVSGLKGRAGVALFPDQASLSLEMIYPMEAPPCCLSHPIRTQCLRGEEPKGPMNTGGRTNTLLKFLHFVSFFGPYWELGKIYGHVTKRTYFELSFFSKGPCK